MKQAGRRIAERIDALGLRERIFVFLGATAVLVALAFTAIIDPAVATSKGLAREVLQKQSEANALQSRITSLLQGKQSDPNREPRARLAALRAELAALDAQVSGEERKFTAPVQMRRIVYEMLARNRRVHLVDLKTLPISLLGDARRGGESAPAPSAGRLIYRHGVELSISGSYLDLLAYVSDLERLPTQLYWGTIDIDAMAYPSIAMKLTVYTLSLDPTWMDV